MRQKRNSPWSMEWSEERDIGDGVGKTSDEQWSE
jgi:hypothetical protein